MLPARIRTFRPHQLDELGAQGWLVWVGHSPLGADDGRIVLYRRESIGRLLAPVNAESVDLQLDERHRAILDLLARRGASFLAEITAAVPGGAQGVTEALWDLVWAGLVTNDTFAALRALAGRSRKASRRPGRSRRNSAFAGGRWSLVRNLADSDVSDTERAHAWAATLLQRHGIVARETAAVEAGRGGFGAIYRVLRSMEDAGRIRRGYFVEGLGGAQFAYPGVVDRLREARDAEDEASVVVLSATDPANPFGWLVPWPDYREPGGRPPRRTTGASVVLVDGVPVAYLDRGGRRLRTMVDASEEQLRSAFTALRPLAFQRPRNTLTIERVDGQPAVSADLTPVLMDAGFTRDYLSLRLYVP
jgi:ATP-dependent Lhr-like helicase